jgi:hypothetical protein
MVGRFLTDVQIAALVHHVRTLFCNCDADEVTDSDVTTVRA